MKHIFPNGLTLLTHSQPGTGYTRISVRVGVGSSHEPPKLRGISHFLEHMLFRGTDRYTSDEQSEAAELMGSTIEAYTSDVATVYSISVRPECLSDALGLLHSMFRAPAFDDIELERNIVQEEILASLDEHKRIIDATQLVTRWLYPSDPRGLPIYGSLESVARISEDDLTAWLERHYVGPNTVCIVTGEVDAEVLSMVAGSLGQLNRGDPTPTPRVQEDQHMGSLHVENAGSQTSVCVAWRVNAPYAKHAAAFNIIASLLGARMYSSLVSDKGLCYETGNSLFVHPDCVVFILSAECTPENSFAVVNSLLEAPNKTFTDRDLKRQVSTTSFELVRSLKSPTGMAAALVEQIDSQAEPLRSEDISALTMSQIEEVRALIDFDAVSIVTVGPSPTLAQLVSQGVSRLVEQLTGVG